MADGPEDGGYTIVGPSVAVISWIPYAFDLVDLDKMAVNEYSRHRHAPALGFLFDSGNPQPPDRFAGHRGFLDYLKTKEFRAACCLREVELRCDGQGRPRGVSYLREEYIGYTPYRMWNRTTRKKSTKHWAMGQRQGGRGNVSLHTSKETAELPLTQTLGFRIGTIGNFGTWALTLGEAQAPWAFAGLEYWLDSSGAAQVRFSGTSIPSHRHYVDWVTCGDHNMLENESAIIDNFLKTRRHEVADVSIFTDWTGFGRRPEL